MTDPRIAVLSALSSPGWHPVPEAHGMPWGEAEELLAAYDASRTAAVPSAPADADLRRQLASSERIRENADFHLGQEMARRQLAEKETARLRADRASVLSPAERTMLNYALNQAQLRMWATGKFTDEDQAAVVSLRRLTAEAQQPAPWLSDSARIGRTLIWTWADIGKGVYGQGYRAAQAEARALLTGQRDSVEAQQPETDGADQCSGCRYVPCGNCPPAAVSQPGKEA